MKIMKIILRLVDDNAEGISNIPDCEIDHILPLGTMIYDVESPEGWMNFKIGKIMYELDTDTVTCLGYDETIDFCD